MKRFILFAFVFALGCNGTNCPVGKRKSNGVCCDNDSYYNKVAKRCEPCHCDSIGAKGWTCNSQAQCDCYNDYTGLQCKQCKQDKRKSHGHCCLEDHYFDLKTRLCTPCHCDSVGARSPWSCDSQAQCDCYDDYTGLQCNQCIESQKESNGHCCSKDHYYNVNWRKCLYCDCYEYGAIGGKKGECDEKGRCYCHALYTDDDFDCSTCASNAKMSNGRCCLKDHYYSEQDNKCIYCDCYEYGAIGGKKGECDEKGQCSCLTGYTETKCQDCTSDFKMTNDRCCKKYEYYALWDNKCRHCRCNELGAKGGFDHGPCNDTGFCYCKTGYHDAWCETCAAGYKMSNGRCCPKDHFWKISKNRCSPCLCDPEGAIGGADGECDGDGQCECYCVYYGKECQKVDPIPGGCSGYG